MRMIIIASLDCFGVVRLWLCMTHQSSLSFSLSVGRGGKDLVDAGAPRAPYRAIVESPRHDDVAYDVFDGVVMTSCPAETGCRI